MYAGSWGGIHAAQMRLNQSIWSFHANSIDDLKRAGVPGGFDRSGDAGYEQQQHRGDGKRSDSRQCFK